MVSVVVGRAGVAHRQLAVFGLFPDRAVQDPRESATVSGWTQGIAGAHRLREQCVHSLSGAAVWIESGMVSRRRLSRLKKNGFARNADGSLFSIRVSLWSGISGFEPGPL